MCVGFYTLEHPEYALVLCTNRDEYLQRLTDLARFHSFEKHDEEQQDLLSQENKQIKNVLSGIDVRAGGTWLGISRTGRIAFLSVTTPPPKPKTNITEEYGSYSSSRGDLVAYFLSSSSSRPLEQELYLIPREAKYAGFNLLLLAPSARGEQGVSFDTAYLTNHGGGGTIVVRPLTQAERTYGGMSNGIDGQGAQAWPKVQHGLHSFQTIMNAVTPNTSEKDIAENLFELLTWKSPHMPRTRSELLNTVQVDPLIFPGSEEGFYGTRLSTVILVKRDGEVLFIERDRWKLVDSKPVLSDPCSQREFRFKFQQEVVD